MKYFLFFMLLTMVAGLALADPKPVPTVINNYYTTTDTPDVTNVTNLTDVSGLSDAEEEAIRGSVVAMCMGSSHFDYANGWQGSASGSWWKDEQAVCGAVGKRIDDILFTGALGCDIGFEDCGGVISGNWHF